MSQPQTPTLLNRMKDHLERTHQWKSKNTSHYSLGQLKDYWGMIPACKDFSTGKTTGQSCSDCKTLLEEWEGQYV